MSGRGLMDLQSSHDSTGFFRTNLGPAQITQSKNLKHTPRVVAALHSCVLLLSLFCSDIMRRQPTEHGLGS